jgi:hypothetical protein
MLDGRIEEQLEEVIPWTAVDLADHEVDVGSPVQPVGRFVGIDRRDPGTSKVLGPPPIDRAEFCRGHNAWEDL